jgi:Na+/phosphate symporter
MPVAISSPPTTPPITDQRLRVSASRAVCVLIGLGLFVSALGIMKSGAQSLYSSLQGSAFTDNAWSTLGLGWLGACLVLSGSPVAASSLTFLSGGLIDRSQAFTMLTGSRLGASFVVLVVGFLYGLRHKGGRRAPVSIGILALTMTMLAYLPGALIGWLLLRFGAFDGLNLTAPPRLLSVTDTAFGWLADIARHVVPGWGLFPVGLAVLLVAFKAFDLALPDLSAERLERRGVGDWFRKPWAMFALGCAVALMTLSVSVALTILVPLVAKGHLKRDETLPYIAGANITTLADTLVAAMLVSNPDAARVVLAEMVGVTIWTVVLIGFMYPTVRRTARRVAGATLSSRSRLAASVVGLFSVPLFLVAV